MNININTIWKDLHAILDDDGNQVACGNQATVTTGDLNMAVKAIINQDYTIWQDWFLPSSGYTRLSQIDDIVAKNIEG